MKAPTAVTIGKFIVLVSGIGIVTISRELVVETRGYETFISFGGRNVAVLIDQPRETVVTTSGRTLILGRQQQHHYQQQEQLSATGFTVSSSSFATSTTKQQQQRISNAGDIKSTNTDDLLIGIEKSQKQQQQQQPKEIATGALHVNPVIIAADHATTSTVETVSSSENKSAVRSSAPLRPQLSKDMKNLENVSPLSTKSQQQQFSLKQKSSGYSTEIELLALRKSLRKKPDGAAPLRIEPQKTPLLRNKASSLHTIEQEQLHHFNGEPRTAQKALAVGIESKHQQVVRTAEGTLSKPQQAATRSIASQQVSTSYNTARRPTTEQAKIVTKGTADSPEKSISTRNNQEKTANTREQSTGTVDTQQEQESSSSSSSTIDGPVQFGLAVAHCTEDFLTWVDGVDAVTLKEDIDDKRQTSWEVSVFERCDEQVHPSFSVPQKNLGSEECSAYVQYILDHYDALPEIVYFLQPDSLAPNSVKQNHQHTEFNTMQALVDASAPLLLRKSNGGSDTERTQLGYLNVGNDFELVTKPVTEVPSKVPEVLALLRDRMPQFDNSTQLRFLSGASFAVRRERILGNPRQFYEDLMELIHKYAPENECWVCWALESLWHVILGEPLWIPESSTLNFRAKENDAVANVNSEIVIPKKPSPASFGLAVAHCTEDFLTWVDGVDAVTLKGDDKRQTSWEVSVFERCDEQVHPSFSVPQKNLGSEECSAYVQYILDHYDDLPEIVYFLQPDSLAPNSVKQNHQHTEFDTMQALVDASAQLLLRKSNGGSDTERTQLGYLNVGNDSELVTKLVVEVPSKVPEVLALLRDRMPQFNNSTQLRFLSGASFAVRRERILGNPRQFYEALMELIHKYAPENECWVCWALESLWHVILGEPLWIPESSTLNFRSKVE